MTPQERSEISEARLFIAIVSCDLTDPQRVAVVSWLAGESDIATAIEHGRTRGGIWMARQAALKKMRRNLEMLGIYSSQDLCSRCG
jgi:hypothetical protein